MLISNISVVIIAKNAEETIEECLEALKNFNEVILYLNDSLDMTENIALNYMNVKVVHGAFMGFGATKNKAASYSQNNWIFSLDSDEILNEKLVEEIRDVSYARSNRLYKLKRDNYFLGYKVQSQDTIVRIYNKEYTQFNDNLVHEKIIIPRDSNTVILNQSFKHLNITNLNQTLTKIIKYTDLSSEDKKMCFFSILIFKSLFSFFKTYFIKGNFIKGWVGFVFSVNVANERYYKYLKLFIHCKKDNENEGS